MNSLPRAAILIEFCLQPTGKGGPHEKPAPPRHPPRHLSLVRIRRRHLVPRRVPHWRHRNLGHRHPWPLRLADAPTWPSQQAPKYLVFFPATGGTISLDPNTPITANQGLNFGALSNYTFAASTASAGSGTGSTSTLGTLNFGTSSINVQTDATATIFTKLAGTNSITKTGPGTLILNTNLNASTTVAQGTLTVNGTAGSGSLNVFPGATAIISAGSFSTLTATTSSNITIKGSVSFTGTNQTIATNMNLGGTLTLSSGTFSGFFSGSGSISKTGAGILTISPIAPATGGAYTGVISASAGTLNLADSFTGPGYTPQLFPRGGTINASNTPLVTTSTGIGGFGTLNGYVSVIDSSTTFGGGVRLQDSAIHALTFNGTLDFRGTKPVKMSFDIASSAADTLNVTTINDNNKAGEVVHVGAVGAIVNPGTYTLIHTTSGLSGVYSLDSTSIGSQLLSLSTDPTNHNLLLTVVGPPAAPHGTRTELPGTSGTGGTGTWDLSTTSFSSGGAQTTWSNTATAAVVFSGAGTINVAGSIKASGGVYLDSNSAYTFAGGTSNSLDVSGGGISGALSSAVFNVSLAGASGLTVATSAASITLSAPNSYTGGTTVASGTLAVTGAGTLGASPGPLVVNDTLQLNNNQTVTSLSGGTGAANVIFSNNAALNVNATTDSTFSGQLSGSGTLQKLGAGKLSITSPTILSAAENPASLTIDGGALAAAAPGMSYFTSLSASNSSTTLTDSTVTNLSVEQSANVDITGNLTLAGPSASVSTDLNADPISVTGALNIADPTAVSIDSGLFPRDYPLFTYGSFTGDLNSPTGLYLGSAVPSPILAAATTTTTLYNDPLTHTIGVRITLVPEPTTSLLLLLPLLRRRRRPLTHAQRAI